MGKGTERKEKPILRQEENWTNREEENWEPQSDVNVRNSHMGYPVGTESISTDCWGR
jgi:hypothetical protein